jgi:8-oxo-dGTP pyrophosphatase MutT (NUDIX family)
MPLPPPDRVAELLASAPENPDLDPEMAQAAVAIAIDWSWKGNGSEVSPAVLLMQRAAHPKDPWSGQVSLPGGRAEEHDRDLRATAIREAHEELEIDLKGSARHLGTLPARRAMAHGGYVDLWITPHVFEVQKPLLPIPGVEASESFWLPLSPARNGELDHSFPYRRQNKEAEGELILPGWRFEERVIWGLTYRMLSALFEHVSPDAD